MSNDLLETHKARARAWFESLRDDICAAFETVEAGLPPAAPFADRTAARPGAVAITAERTAAAG